MKKLNENPLLMVLSVVLVLAVAVSLALLTPRRTPTTESVAIPIITKSRLPRYSPFPSTAPTSLGDPFSSVTTTERTPESVASPESKPETDLRRRFQAPNFIHFSGIVVEKTKDQIKIRDLNMPSYYQPLLLTILDGNGARITVYDDSFDLTGKQIGWRPGSWSEIPLGALVGATGYYFQIAGQSYLDTTALDWQEKSGEIEIIAQSLRS